MWHIYTTKQQDRQYTYNIILRRVHITIVGHVKEISIKYSGCVSVALVVQHARCMHRIILSSVASLDLILIFFTSHKRREIRKNLLQTKCVFSFSLQL